MSPLYIAITGYIEKYKKLKEMHADSPKVKRLSQQYASDIMLLIVNNVDAALEGKTELEKFACAINHANDLLRKDETPIEFIP